jgi:2-polyprenyl-3-methyl-5-hydroxy-6-metoxy-1,4-benzoquinol methylase
VNCRHCQDAEKTFNRRMAERDLHDYHAHGPGKTTRLLIEAFRAAGIEGLTLLDIGGGVGVVQHELLNAGVTSAIAVEASSAYLEVGRQEAERQGHAQRITSYYGDFVDLAAQLPQADIVILEKVICCYPDMRTLVSLSSAHASRLYGIVFPHDTWWMNVGGRLANLLLRLQRSSFRLFVHPTADIEAVARASGLSRRYYRKTLLWQVIVYAR